MSGTKLSSRDLDRRRSRILFRAWHRGTREMDLILGSFVDAEIATMSEEDVTAFEQLIDLQDDELYAWTTGMAAIPTAHDTAVWRRLLAFHAKRVTRQT
jgi:antitoxin CptB